VDGLPARRLHLAFFLVILAVVVCAFSALSL